MGIYACVQTLFLGAVALSSTLYGKVCKRVQGNKLEPNNSPYFQKISRQHFGEVSGVKITQINNTHYSFLKLAYVGLLFPKTGPCTCMAQKAVACIADLFLISL